MNGRSRLHAIPLAVLVLLAACSSPAGGSAPALDDVSASIGAIRSGELDIAFRMTDGAGDAEVGFRIAGPFSLGNEGEPTVADLTLEQIAGETTTSTRFVMDGDAAYAIVDEQAYVLPDDRRAALAAFADAPSGGVLASLDLGTWLDDPAEVGTGSVGDDPTRVLSGDVRVPEAIAGIGALFGGAGAPGVVPSVASAEERERLESAVRSASLEVEVGADDGVFRGLHLDLVLGSADEVLREFAGARLRFTVRIASPNEPVEVSPPADAVPLPS